MSIINVCGVAEHVFSEHQYAQCSFLKSLAANI